MNFHTVKLRVKELAEALNVDCEDVIATCIILRIPASSPLTSLSIEQCKRVTDFYDKWNIKFIPGKNNII